MAVLDTISRIYKNSAGNVIGIHTITLQQSSAAINTLGTFPDPEVRFARRVKPVAKFQKSYLDPGESRVIDTVQVLGSFDSSTLVGSNDDIATVTYEGNSFENDVTISLTDYPTVGDTI